MIRSAEWQRTLAFRCVERLDYQADLVRWGLLKFGSGEDLEEAFRLKPKFSDRGGLQRFRALFETSDGGLAPKLVAKDRALTGIFVGHAGPSEARSMNSFYYDFKRKVNKPELVFYFPDLAYGLDVEYLRLIPLELCLVFVLSRNKGRLVSNRTLAFLATTTPESIAERFADLREKGIGGVSDDSGIIIKGFPGHHGGYVLEEKSNL